MHLTRIKRLAATTMGLLLAVGGMMVVSAPSASAGACYDGAKEFHKPRDEKYTPTGDGWWETTSRCSDINVKAGGNIGKVQVCFQASGCQDSWKLPTPGEWTVIASNVKNGTKFKLHFYAQAAESGLVAY